MTISVQNSNAALIALQTLNRLNDPAQAQTASTTDAAATAANDPAVAGGAQTPAGPDSLSTVAASLDRAASVSDVALAAGQTIADLLTQMKQTAGGATDASLQSSDRSALNTTFTALLQKIAQTVAGAGVDGANLIDGSSSQALKFLIGADGATASLSPQNLTLGGPNISVSSTASLTTASAAASVLNGLGSALDNVSSAVSQIAYQSRQIHAHGAFVQALNAALGSGPTTGGDMSADSARLLALQVQQQLTVQPGAIANAAPQAVLALFQ